jgi:hypothetical protein
MVQRSSERLEQQRTPATSNGSGRGLAPLRLRRKPPEAGQAPTLAGLLGEGRRVVAETGSIPDELWNAIDAALETAIRAGVARSPELAD